MDNKYIVGQEVRKSLEEFFMLPNRKFYNRDRDEWYEDQCEYKVTLIVDGEVRAVLHKYKRSELFFVRPYDDLTNQELEQRLKVRQY